MRRWSFPMGALLTALTLCACSTNSASNTPSPPQPLPAVANEPAPSQDPSIATVPGPSAAGVAAAPVVEPARPQGVRVQFAPTVGATAEAAAPLTRRLSQRAAERGIALAAAGDAAASHLMRGYFSAISDNGGTTVIYVWDILDQAGNRLHRIQGQETVAGARAEGWAGVPAATMEIVGDKTIDQLATWLAARSG